MTSPNGIYAARACTAWCRLSEHVFDVLNKEGAHSLAWVGYGCIDAPDQIPAGSVRSYGLKEAFVMQSLVQRTEEDYAESLNREALASQLIAEILEEERKGSESCK